MTGVMTAILLVSWSSTYGVDSDSSRSQVGVTFTVRIDSNHAALVTVLYYPS